MILTDIMKGKQVSLPQTGHKGAACHFRVSFQTLLPVVFPLLLTNPNRLHDFFDFQFLTQFFVEVILNIPCFHKKKAAKNAN